MSKINEDSRNYTFLQIVHRLKKEVKQYKRNAILSVVFASSEGFAEILIPFMTSKIIDEGISMGNMQKIYMYGGAMVCLAAIALLCGVLCAKHASRASSGFAANLRSSMYRSIQGFSFSNIDKYSTSGLVTRLTTDVTNVQNSFQMLIRACIRSPIALLFSLAMAMFLNIELSKVFLVAIVFLIGALSIMIYHATIAFDKVFVKYDDLNESVQENVIGIRVVKSFVREDFEREKFKKAVDNIYKMFVKAESIVCVNFPIMMVAIYGCMIGLSWFGAIQVVEGRFTTGQLTTMFSYVMSILVSLMMLSIVFVMLTMSASSAQRIMQVLAEESDITNPEQPVMEVKDGSIDFNHVDFSYDPASHKNALEDIDIHIKSGEVIGIIGGTGSSKTTLVSLISRLYDATSGSVLVGGVDVRQYDLKVLRDKVSVVLQKNELFSGSVYDNLRWGDENATDEECINACKIACADDFVSRMPDGYNTWIEQNGSNVSGGQKQRLCIARALLKKPNILILDDSTSAVDTATESKIRRAFREDIPDTTKIIISQRISSVKDADRILVLDEGRITGFDTHEKLLETSEIYQSIYEIQLESNADFDENTEDK